MIIWLVVSTPLKNMSSSAGVIIPTIWKNKKYVPNHQPDITRLHINWRVVEPPPHPYHQAPGVVLHKTSSRTSLGWLFEFDLGSGSSPTLLSGAWAPLCAA